jgi:hypothetical protein
MENSVLPISLLPMKRAIYYGFHYYDRYFNSRQKHAVFKSPFFKCWNRRKYKLTTIADAITNSFSTYYNPTPSVNQLPPQSSCDSNCNFRQPNFSEIYSWTKEPWTYFLLRSLRHGQWFYCIKCISQLVYGSTTITNAVFKIDTKEDALVYNQLWMTFKTVNSNCLTSITGKVQTIRSIIPCSKRCKGCRKILTLWNAKSIGRK